MTASPAPGAGRRRLVGVASVLVDLTIRVPALPPRGGDVLGEDAGRAAGGGINTLTAAARLGLPTVYAGRHGTGPSGDAVRRDLAGDGIVALRLPELGGDTGTCLVLLEPDGERTFVTVAGVEALLDGESLDAVHLQPGDVVYASGYDLAYPGSGPALSAWLARLPAGPPGGPLLVLDPGPLAGEIPRDLLAPVLARVDVLTVSTGELATLGGAPALLAARHPGAVLVHRMGARGVTAWPAAATLHAASPGPPVEVPAALPPGPVVDTNGAGDVHTGAVVAGMCAGLGLVDALRVAAAAAAWSVTRPGASSGPTCTQLAAAFPALAPLPCAP